jgi:hypothetical protein
MVRIAGWLDQRAPDADRAAATYLKRQAEEAEVAQFHAAQAARLQKQALADKQRQEQAAESGAADADDAGTLGGGVRCRGNNHCLASSSGTF